MKNTIIASAVLSVLLLWNCSKEEASNASEVKSQEEVSVLAYDNSTIELGNATIQEINTGGSEGNRTYKIAAGEAPKEFKGAEELSNGIYLDITIGKGDEIKGTYEFVTGETKGSEKVILYGMLVVNGKTVGIKEGQIEITEQKEGDSYHVDYNVKGEDGKQISGVVTAKNGGVKAELKATEAYCSGCKDNYNKAISANEALAMAKRYAPILNLDKAASTYPDWASTVFDAAGNKSCGQRLSLEDRSIIERKNKNFTTYFDVQVSPKDSRRVFIDYWWVYARQPNCFLNSGGHDFDWEHIVIQFNKSTWTPSTITFFQHGGSYTQRLSVEHDKVYVGKVGHGSYHDAGGSGGCCYWADYRNPNSSTVFHTENKLYQMRCSYDAFAFSGDWGGGGRKGPLYRSRKYWDRPPCEGASTQLCTESGCAKGDYKSTKLGEIENGFN